MPTKDKERQAKYAKAHYLKNKEKVIARAHAFTKMTTARNRAFTTRVKRRYGCSHCGMKVPVCLDFHHLRDKVINIAEAVKQGYSIEKLKEEIRKCIILCSNCHRIETHKRGNHESSKNSNTVE